MAYAVAGVLAVIAADLLHRALAWRGSPEVWHAIEPWVPTIIPAHADYTVAPWPAMIWLALLFTVGFALAAVSVFVLRIRPSHRRWVRALVLWGGVVIVGVGVAGVAQLGEWLLWTESFGGAGGSFLRTFTVPALWEAARWGLLWGWIPAVVAVALSGVPSPRPRARGVLILCVGLVVAAAVAATCLAAATRGAAQSASTEVAQPEPTEPSAPPAPTDPPSEVASSAAPDFPGRCSEDDVVVSIAGSDAATGTRYLAFEVRNVSSAACDVNGLPDLAFASPEGNAIRPLIEPREHSSVGESIGPDAVTLEPGGSARADLVWRAPTGRFSELTVLMAQWPGAQRTTATEMLDVVDGGEMTLTPWYVGE